MAKVVEGVAIAGAAALTLATGGLGAIAMTATMKSIAEAAIMTGASMTMEGVAQMLAGGPTNAIALRNPIAPWQYVYGEMRVTGLPIFLSTTGGNKAQFNNVIIWAAHQIQSIDAIYLDGKQIYFDGQLGSNWGNPADQTYYDVNGNKYNFSGQVYVEHRYGYPGQLVRDNSGVNAPTNYISGLTANDPTWTSACTVDGKAYSYIKLEHNTSLFPSWPGMKATIHGKNDILDPRTGQRGYTNNWALVIADFLCDPHLGFGSRITMDDIDQEQLIAAANICDEQISLANGGSAGQIIEIPVTSGGQYLSGESATVTISGDGSGATAVAIMDTNDPTGEFWFVSSIQIEDGGKGYTTASVTIDGNATLGAPVIGNSTLTEPRYTINGAISADSTPGAILETMLAAAEGRITITNGKIGIYPAAWYGTNLVFDQSDLVGGIKWTSKRKFRDLCNGVRGQYVSPVYPYNATGYDRDHPDQNVFSGQWQPTDFPEYAADANHGYSDDIFLTQDGVRLWADVKYQFVTSVAAAQRLAKIHLLRNRNQGTGTLPLSLAAYQAQAQDVIGFNFEPFSWTNKYLEVSNFRFAVKGSFEDPMTAPVITCEADVCETDPSVYEWFTYEEEGVEGTPSPKINDGTQVPAPTNLAIQDDDSTAMTLQDGTTLPRMLVTWTEPADTDVVYSGSIQVQYQLSTSPSQAQPVILSPTYDSVHLTWISEWVDAGSVSGMSTSTFVPGINTSQYQNISVRIRSVRSNGATSDWVQVSNHVLSIRRPTFPIGGGGPILGPIFTFIDTGRTLDTLEPAEGGAEKTTGKPIDILADGTTYGRPLLSRLSGGKPLIDFAEDIHLNKTLDNVADGSSRFGMSAASGATESIVPNGNFALGDINGWYYPEGAGGVGGFSYTSANGGGLLIPGGANRGAGSPVFRVIPGQKYRIIFNAFAGSGTQSVYLRVNYAGVYQAQITKDNRTGLYDFMAGGSVATSLTQYAYDWTCPAGVYYASLAVYEWSNCTANIQVGSVLCIPYAAAAQWGADVTSQNIAGGVNGHAIIARASGYNQNPINGATVVNDAANGASLGNVAAITAGWAASTTINAAHGFAPTSYDVYVRVRSNGTGSNPTSLPSCGIYDNATGTYLTGPTTLNVGTYYQEIALGRIALTSANINDNITTFFSQAGVTTTYYIDYIRFVPVALNNRTQSTGTTARPAIAYQSWADLPELGGGNPAMSASFRGAPCLVSVALDFNSSSGTTTTTYTIDSLGWSVGTCFGSQPPSISISISGNGTGASASVTWTNLGSSYVGTQWSPVIHLTPGSGYTQANATVTVTVPQGTIYNGQPSGTYACGMAAQTTYGQYYSGQPVIAQVTLDGIPVMGPFFAGTDTGGNASITASQIVFVPSGGHTFAVQAMTTGVYNVYSTSRAFQLVELG